MLSVFNDFHMTVSKKTGIIRKYQDITLWSICLSAFPPNFSWCRINICSMFTNLINPHLLDIMLREDHMGCNIVECESAALVYSMSNWMVRGETFFFFMVYSQINGWMKVISVKSTRVLDLNSYKLE